MGFLEFMEITRHMEFRDLLNLFNFQNFGVALDLFDLLNLLSQEASVCIASACIYNINIFNYVFQLFEISVICNIKS